MDSLSTSKQAVCVYPGVRGAETVVAPPADKSIAQRLIIMSLLCRGGTEIRGTAFGADCISTARAVSQLGAEVRLSADRSYIGIIPAESGIQQPAQELDLGNSGTGMRLLAGLVAGYPVEVVLTGDASLQQRPMRRIAEPLRLMGAQVDLLGEGGRPPVRIRGGGLRGIRYEMPIASAQVKSCILLAGLAAEGETEIVEPGQSRDHTERLLRLLGAAISVEGNRISLRGCGSSGPYFEGRTWAVPGDFSAAAYFMALAAAARGRVMTVRDVNLNPRRTAFAEALQLMGARVRMQEVGEHDDWEPVGWIRVEGAELTGVVVRGEQIPRMIDELPLIAVLGAVAHGETVIRDAAELRVKECDRIAATAEGLRRLGVEVEEYVDGLAVRGPAEFSRQPVEVETHGDHRIAMAFAVLATYAHAPVIIREAASTEISCPAFWERLSSCGVRVEDA